MKMLEKRKVIVSTVLSLVITFLHVAGWQISMDYGSSVHQSEFFQNIGVLETWQCLVWGMIEWVVLNVLFYRMFTVLEIRAERSVKERGEIKYLWIYVFVVLLAIWYFFLWGCYPGYYNYDTGNQLIQVLYDEVPYNAHHPLLHTLFSGGLITLGYRIDSTDLVLGVFLDNAVQMFLLAICLTYSLRYVYRRTYNMVLTVASFCFYAFCPPIVMFALSPTKDVLCYGVLLVAIIRLRELYGKIGEGQSPAFKDWLCSGGLLALSSLIRKNIIYAVVVFALCSLLMVKKERKKQSVMFLCTILLCYSVDKTLMFALEAIPGSVNEALCAPYQAMARLCNEKGEEAFTEEEYALLSAIVPPESLSYYDPVMADGVKANFNPGLETLLENKGDYIKLWVKKGIEYPDVFLESILYNTYQAWYPGTMIMDHSGVRYFDVTDWDDEYAKPNWQGLYDYYKDVRWGEYAKYPVVRLLFAIGTMFWITIITWFYSIWRKDKTAILALLLVLLVCGTNFLGPVSDVRYYLILFYVVPVCLGLMLERKLK